MFQSLEKSSSCEQLLNCHFFLHLLFLSFPSLLFSFIFSFSFFSPFFLSCSPSFFSPFFYFATFVNQKWMIEEDEMFNFHNEVKCQLLECLTVQTLWHFSHLIPLSNIFSLTLLSTVDSTPKFIPLRLYFPVESERREKEKEKSVRKNENDEMKVEYILIPSKLFSWFTQSSEHFLSFSLFVCVV